MTPEFTSIHVATLRGDLKIPFDVYVRIAGRFIHYCRAGDSFEGKRLDRLKAKKIRNMFIKLEDALPYKLYVEQSIDQAYDDKSSKSLDVRAEVIQGFQQAEAENYMLDPTNNVQYTLLKSSVDRFVDLIRKEPKAAQAIVRIPNTDASIGHHSVSVATMAAVIGSDLKLKDPQQISMLTLGCMVHDIDLFHSDIDLTKPLAEMTPDERSAYRFHPTQGSSRLEQAKFVDPFVLNIVQQHEEWCNGGGFPRGLKEKELDPLSLVAGAANAFDRLISFERLQPKEAMTKVLIDKMGLYPLEYLQSLQRFLKQSFNF